MWKQAKNLAIWLGGCLALMALPIVLEVFSHDVFSPWKVLATIFLVGGLIYAFPRLTYESARVGLQREDTPLSHRLMLFSCLVFAMRAWGFLIWWLVGHLHLPNVEKINGRVLVLSLLLAFLVFLLTAWIMQRVAVVSDSEESMKKSGHPTDGEEAKPN